uniref:F-box domain-containing protein n=1 Tax=Brassica oleracea var. oleracea TaxID=109376 RepID=A0A0D3CRB8_BRAOL
MESRQQKDHQTFLTRSSNSTNAEEYSEPIPADLIIEIVLRLPTKSVARCRCVSKFWPSTLRRQDFTEIFFARYFSQPDQLLFACVKDNGTEDVFVWKICNPSTRQCFTLPELKTHKEFSLVRTFFGYDQIEKQVKVLTITGEHEEEDNAISDDEHHVLTLETDKISWRRIECGTPHSPSSGTSLCISGVLYYRASEKAFSNASMIVCFDL